MKTDEATELSGDAATLNGQMTECYGEIKEYGFYFGTELTKTDQKIIVGEKEYVAKPFSKRIDQLKPGTYFYKAFATNATDTGYGPLMEFTIKQTSGDNNTAPDGIKVKLDDQLLTFDVQPSISNGRTLVPLRGIFEALGANVSWDGAARKIIATRGDLEITLVINGAANINGVIAPLDEPARIVSGRTLVPLRFVSEAMQCKVDWNGAAQTVTITSIP
ncbi:copper amine oxidase N-terminal domain-containing protein [Sporotomaculum syntrophicum]|uniref:copper amine oxidase N-terminal domain-containing protein n=1 Tax=Sporotomaculum syntrophicum TaxID=182264 RepID=UPI00137AF994|nr:copper amine oxidase N-terminal domain-containing protein [Sporotomaculum syntrophicum]